MFRAKPQDRTGPRAAQWPGNAAGSLPYCAPCRTATSRPGTPGSGHEDAYRAALRSARGALLALRNAGDIGDDAFHTLENDLDWLEASDPLRAANADETEAPA